ncbi:sulfotransferase family 2 domain-containing protein [Fodinibius sediminis]|uniref:Sulfotransferase family protein n=1 Tax=Fodinibius sediminis TaxID=1214077 RepID=A0A521D562_9BACT|nr:sulfotransferase family 2 domain-containing protein [Fodinibius sediminis]SMO66824.1 Sulfotransferase family protein [Fodinibius sediminis]
MGGLRRTWDELRLYSRYAFRKMGWRAYQIHQIYLPEQKLIYIPIPKNACTSIKHALHEIEFDKRFDSDLPEFSDYREHHDYYKKRSHAFTSVKALRKADAFRFALVRDPVRRLLSCYRNRVVDLKDLHASRRALERMQLPVEPDLNTFVLNLEHYRQASKSIDHHSRPQSQFLGGTLSYLDNIYTLDEMPELVKMLRAYKPDLELRRRKTGGTRVILADLSAEALDYALQFYHEDYKLLDRYVSRRELTKAFRASKA